MITCNGCGLEFQTASGYGHHLDRPTRMCWRALEIQIDAVLIDLQGNRVKRGDASDLIIQTLKSLYALGIDKGLEDR